MYKRVLYEMLVYIYNIAVKIIFKHKIWLLFYNILYIIKVPTSSIYQVNCTYSISYGSKFESCIQYVI